MSAGDTAAAGSMGADHKIGKRQGAAAA